MLILVLLGGFALSLGASLALIPLVRTVGVRMGWLDRPDGGQPDGGRKVHVRPIPRVGGLGIMAAFLLTTGGLALARPWLPAEIGIALALPAWPIWLGGLLMAVVGFVDDVRDLNALPKLIAQAFIALLVVAGGYRIAVFDAALGGGELAFGVSVVLTLIWVVGVINGVNFIDGLDGLAAGVVTAALVGLGGAYLIGGDLGGLIVAVAAVGAVLGFLRYNAAPASIFMGDVGSHFLGYVLAVYALQGTAHADPVVALIVAAVAMGLPVLDTLVTLFRRPQYDKPLLHSDGDHFHHRLLLHYPKATVVRILWMASAVFAVGAMAMAAAPAGVALGIFAVGVLGVFGFLHRLGYLPGRYATGPADRRRRSVPMDVEVNVGGDGALHSAEANVVRPSRPAAGAPGDPDPSQALTPAVAPER